MPTFLAITAALLALVTLATWLVKAPEPDEQVLGDPDPWLAEMAERVGRAPVEDRGNSLHGGDDSGA